MPIDARVRLLYASDLHLGRRWSVAVVDEIVRHVRAEQPDAMLLGGDLADTSAGLVPLRRLLREIRDVTPTIAAVLGNHDRWQRGEPVRAALREGGAILLDRDACPLRGISLIGQPDAIDDGSRAVLVAHDPAIYKRSRHVCLTLAGHLHGGQCVLWNRGAEQWPGWLINRHTLLRREDATSTLIVSRGAADTLPLRLNCPREVVLVTLAPP